VIGQASRLVLLDAKSYDETDDCAAGTGEIRWRQIGSKMARLQRERECCICDEEHWMRTSGSVYPLMIKYMVLPAIKNPIP
jgi:hypothetical protein